MMLVCAVAPQIAQRIVDVIEGRATRREAGGEPWLPIGASDQAVLWPDRGFDGLCGRCYLDDDAREIRGG
jgi:hypothetical protein